MRGEKPRPYRGKHVPLGSPPHARGKALSASNALRVVRITPACAGKRGGEIVATITVKDHPRMRGEKRADGQPVIPGAGSPPHARGKDNMNLDSGIAKRITPACAGKSDSPQRLQLKLLDHPRMRGEKDGSGVIKWQLLGSPPHARGKVLPAPSIRCKTRITPACAGKSSCSFPQSARYKDHPRMRGEKLIFKWSEVQIKGSPPHARGKGQQSKSRQVETGITPACAGKSIINVTNLLINGDHPRMRGEKNADGNYERHKQGSPPHARGKVSKQDPPDKDVRITPACAGKSLSHRQPGI